MLYYEIWYTLLYYTISNFTVKYLNPLTYNILYYIVLYCTLLYYTGLHRIVLYCNRLNLICYTLLYGITLQYTMINYPSLYIDNVTITTETEWMYGVLTVSGIKLYCNNLPLLEIWVLWQKYNLYMFIFHLTSLIVVSK